MGTRLGFGYLNGVGYFKVKGWWGVIERSGLGDDELRSQLVEFVVIGDGEERLVEEEEEEEEEERQQRSHDWWVYLVFTGHRGFEGYSVLFY